MTRVRVHGLPDVLRLLDELADLDVESAARAAAEQIARAARPPRRTGRLAASIRVTQEGTTTLVGSDLVYAGVIHEGWPRHNISPNPYLTDAAAAAGGWLDTFTDHLIP